MVAVIVPNIEYSLFDGQVVTIWLDKVPSTGGTKVMESSLAAGDPKIDLRIGHPVLGIYSIGYETAGADSENFTQDGEMERGTSGDSAGEWQIVDADTWEIYSTPDKDYIPGITYIAFGGRRI